MWDLKWSPGEKTIARSAFDAALEQARARLVAEFKKRAAAATTASDVWELEEYLRRGRREFDEMFDYRYSQLLLVFAPLIREGHLEEATLSGLSAEKLEIVRRLLE